MTFVAVLRADLFHCRFRLPLSGSARHQFIDIVTNEFISFVSHTSLLSFTTTAVRISFICRSQRHLVYPDSTFYALCSPDIEAAYLPPDIAGTYSTSQYIENHVLGSTQSEQAK